MKQQFVDILPNLETKFNSMGGSKGRVQGVPPSPRDDLRFSNTTGILPKKKKNSMSFIGVEVEQETSAPPPKKTPGSAPEQPVRLV